MAGNFFSLRCDDCENEQVVFGKAASVVDCAVCGSTLAALPKTTCSFSQSSHWMLKKFPAIITPGR